MAANRRLNASITIGGAISASLKSALGSTTKGLDRIGDSVRRLSKEQRMLGSAIQTLGKQGSNVDGLRAKYARVTDELQKQRGVMSRLQAIEERRNAAIQKRGALLGTMYRMAGATAAVGGAAFAMGRKAAAQQRELTMIGNTADMTPAEVKAMSGDIMSASRVTGQSVADITSGLGFLVAAGMKVGDAVKNVEILGKTATATGADMNDLAQTTFTLQNTLGVSIGETARAMDILSQAGKEGNFELADMAKNLPNLGAQFKTLGATGLEAASSMGALLQVARQGAGSSDEAANNLRNFLQKATAPETLKRFEKIYGVNFYAGIQAAQKSGKNPIEYAIEETARLTKGDAKALGELFGDMQVQAFLRPAIQNWEEYRRIKDSALGAKGTVDKDFASMMATASQQGVAIGAAFDRLSKTIGTALLPAFGNLAGAIIPVVDRMTAWTEANPGLAKGIIGVTTAALGLGTAFTALRIAATFMNPIGLAIGALAGAAVLVYKNWDPIKAWWLDLWGSAKAVVGNAWDWFKEKLSWHPLAMVANNWDGLKTYFSGLLDDIVGMFRKSFDWIVGKIEWVGQKWQDTKLFFGFGDEAPAASIMDTATSDANLAPVPRWQTQAAEAALNDNRTINMTVNAAPGMSPDQVADLAVRKMDYRDGVRSRSRAFDFATP